MAVSPIAGAVCAGKSVIAHAAILRAAHANARSRIANNRAWRSYRHAFADALRMEWRRTKDAAALAEAVREDSEFVLPPDLAARVASIRTLASYEPHTSVGHANFRALHSEANEVALAARLMMIPAKGARHAAL